MIQTKSHQLKPKIKSEPSSKKHFESFQRKPSEISNSGYRTKIDLPLLRIEKIQKILDSTVIQIIDIILTFLLVVGFDAKPLFLSAKYDVIFSSLEIICLVYLFIELVFKSYINERKFFCSIYFWIDLAAAFSLIFDLHWINYAVLNALAKTYNNYSKDQWQTITNVSQCIKVFTRSNRVLHLCQSIDWFKKKDINKTGEKNKVIESRFDNLIQKRIIILALLMLIAMNIFNPKLYLNNTISPIFFSIESFQYFNDDSFNEVFETYVNFYKTKSTPLFYLKAYGREYKNQTVDLNDLRPLEYIKVYSNCPDTINQCLAIIDNRIEMRLYYIMNIAQGIIVCVILVVGMFEFYRSTHELAIDPIKKMALKIKNLSKNPVAALQENIEIDNKNDKKSKSKLEKIPIEITLLEKTVTKICGLLSLGFGEAGSEIISTVLKEGPENDMNPMISGKKIMAIYGFCDIRNFTDTTEVLQEKVMIFVNEVAEIVHEVTADFMGSANKNIGDAFLLVWKIDPKYTFKKGDQLHLTNCFEVNQIVDMALIAFIKIIIKIRRSSKLAKYSLNKELNQRIPNYKISLGFGLHLGYSIEGAIGSMFKIDASYLSPNVELAGAIQERTKDFGKELILSQVFVDYLSKPAKDSVRRLGEHVGDSIYTVDLDLSKIEVEKEKKVTNSIEELNLKIEHIKQRREKSKKRYRNISSFQMNVWNEYMKDKDMLLVRQKYKKT